jgi:two-component system, NtrC family, response regulator PilR
MILLLDDVPGVVVAFGGVLRRMSVPYHAAATVAEATALLPQHSWSAFVFDLELPDGSGIDLLEWVRSHAQWQDTPAAIITASILLDDVVVDRIYAARGTLHCGAFTGPDIETILRELMTS